MVNIVHFSTNHIADILYVGDKYTYTCACTYKHIYFMSINICPCIYLSLARKNICRMFGREECKVCDECNGCNVTANRMIEIRSCIAKKCKINYDMSPSVIIVIMIQSLNVNIKKK